jgi:hypothetical protein
MAAKTKLFASSLGWRCKDASPAWSLSVGVFADEAKRRLHA